MAEVKPFRGIRYNLNLQDQLEMLTTPPYDVIDAASQEKYYHKHPYNIIRLELPKGSEEETGVSSRYSNAAATFKGWLQKDILVREPEPAIYIYQQQFADGNTNHTRTGFIASLKAEPYAAGSVLPHEETIAKHKEDRLRLVRACNANFSSIFGLYHDPEHQVDGKLLAAIETRPAELEFSLDGVTQRMWIIKEQEILEHISREMSERRIYIADGHHRYETAVQFGQEMQEKGKQGYERVMITLVNLFDPGLVVYPTHRLVKNVPNLKVERLLTNLKQHFVIEPIKKMDGRNLGEVIGEMERKGKASHTFGMYIGGGKGYVLQLLGDKKPEEILDQEHSPQWRKLDVSVLHGMILEAQLGIDSQSRSRGTNLAYTRDELEALEAVDRGDFQISFLMNATKVEEVIEVAGAGDKMPQKSTFFYPKLITGLVVNPLG